MVVVTIFTAVWIAPHPRGSTSLSLDHVTTKWAPYDCMNLQEMWEIQMFTLFPICTVCFFSLWQNKFINSANMHLCNPAILSKTSFQKDWYSINYHFIVHKCFSCSMKLDICSVRARKVNLYSRWNNISFKFAQHVMDENNVCCHCCMDSIHFASENLVSLA